MSILNTHQLAILLMVVAASLWSTAGVLARHLEEVRSFEITFWRSLFSAGFVAVALLALLEVLLGAIWAWLGAGKVPARETLLGGAVVLAALVFNELSGLRAGKSAAVALPPA